MVIRPRWMLCAVLAGGGACVGPDSSDDGKTDDGSTDGGDTDAVGDFVPDPVVEPSTVSTTTTAPIYIYMFAHTEDHINHELSEERYRRLLPEVDRIDQTWPEAHAVWNIMFQGADAQTVGERNTDGVADDLRAAGAAGLVSFGYHAQHDPTSSVRPQKDLAEAPTFEEVVDAIDTWVSCEKHPTQGGCVSSTGGGALAILDHFGSVDTVSGLVARDGLFVEGDPVRHALSKYVPGRMAGFGFSDHAPGGDAEYDTAKHDLAVILTPGVETCGSVFWMDGALRISDGEPLAGVSGVRLMDPTHELVQALGQLDRSHPNVLNTSLGSKWIYTKEHTPSPTSYAYMNPDEPELPLDSVNLPVDIENNYQASVNGMEYLAEHGFADNTDSRFVSGPDLVEMVAPDTYWEVSDETLEALARWVLLKWDGQPPPYTTDGTDFYSLRDTFVLLAAAITADASGSTSLALAYGPADPPTASDPAEISADVVRSLAESLDATLKPDATWLKTPTNMLQGGYDAADSASYTTAQVLYAMAHLYAATYAGKPPDSIAIPATEGNPETLPLLEAIGCLPLSCAGSAWSLKPARLPMTP